MTAQIVDDLRRQFSGPAAMIRVEFVFNRLQTYSDFIVLIPRREGRMAHVKNTFRALKAGIRGFADANGPSRYVAVGRQVSCTHCGMSLFVEREALLNTTGATLVNLDWLNKSGTALVCENCGLIQWFGMKPERAE